MLNGIFFYFIYEKYSYILLIIADLIKDRKEI